MNAVMIFYVFFSVHWSSLTGLVEPALVKGFVQIVHSKQNVPGCVLSSISGKQKRISQALEEHAG